MMPLSITQRVGSFVGKRAVTALASTHTNTINKSPWSVSKFLPYADTSSSSRRRPFATVPYDDRDHRDDNDEGGITKSTNSDLAKRRVDAIARGVGMMTQVYADRALNAEVWDVEGTRYLDFSAGIAVTNTGHCHPRIIQAVTNQIQNHFTHTCHQVMPYENYIALAERLNTIAPTTGNVKNNDSRDNADVGMNNVGNKTIFVTTGAEAVENAIKIARHHSGRDAVLSFAGGFHGRTFMGMSLTGKVKPYKPFGALMPSIYHIPFPMQAHDVTVEDSMKAIETLFRATIEPSNVAAIIIEPIQGEGGFYVAPTALMRGLRRLCDEHGIVLIADEVQSGFARTGKMFAMEHYAAADNNGSAVQADLVTMAKGLGGGVPIAACTGRADIMDSADPGGLGGTYAGNPLGIAAAHAVLDVIEDEQLCHRAYVLGSKLTSRLRQLQSSSKVLSDILVDVRGPGLMVAAEFNDPITHQPNPQLTNRVRELALERNLILLTCGVYGNVIRFLPPLTIPDDHFDEGLDIIQSCIEQAAHEYQ